jgi:TolB protein
MYKKISRLFFFVCAVLLFHPKVSAQVTPVGIFDGQDDIGKVKKAGTGTYDNFPQEYQISGSGTNIWATHDEFHFVWKKMKGDFILRTDAAFIGKGVE